MPTTPVKAQTKLLGSMFDDSSNALTTDLDGAIYVGGLTDGALDGQSYSGAQDAFLTKYSADGSKAWTKLLDTSVDDIALTLTTGLDSINFIRYLCED